MNLNKLAKNIHKLNHKWWHDAKGRPLKRNKGELLMLVITELAEAVEGIRKDLMDDKLPHRKMEEVEMADAVIRLLDFAGGFGLSLTENPRCKRVIAGDAVVCGYNKSDQILQICDTVCNARNHLVYQDELIVQAIGQIEFYCHLYSLNLWGTVKEKLEFNKTRKDHTHAARARKNGKKF